MIVNVEALFECDECGTRFKVGIDPADNTPLEPMSMLEIAESAIMGGLSYQDDAGTPGPGSVDGINHYCHLCTKERNKR